jgi:hypothetical protein
LLANTDIPMIPSRIADSSPAREHGHVFARDLGSSPI